MTDINLLFTPIVFDDPDKSWREFAVEVADDFFYTGGTRIHVKNNNATYAEDAPPLFFHQFLKVTAAILTLGVIPIAALACKLTLNPRDSLTGLYTDPTQNKITQKQRNAIGKVIGAGSASLGAGSACKSKPVVTIDLASEVEDLAVARQKGESKKSGGLNTKAAIMSACDNSWVVPTDLARLEDDVWLNDACMNTLFENLIVGSRDCLIANSYLLSISKPYKMFRGSNASSPTALFQDKKPVFVPLNVRKVHWVLLKIDVETQKIHYYDSLSWTPGVEVENVKQLMLRHAELEGAPLRENAFEIVIENCPQQTNGNDCGVFTYMAALRLMRGEPLTYSATDVPAMRLQMRGNILAQVADHEIIRV